MGKIVTVDFRQDTLFAIERDDGVFVAIKPICDALGLAWNKQRERIQRDPILSQGGTMVVLPSVGGPQETLCLKLELVNGWLFTIDHDRVRDDETREKVLAYKRECYSVLFQHFYGRATGRVAGPADDEPTSSDGTSIRQVAECRHVFGVRAAGQLWFKLGLPVVPAMLHDPAQAELFDYPGIKTVDEAPPEKSAA